MEYTVNLNSVNLVNADSLQFIKTLPDSSVDLIATDPPYYRVKACKWDNQWKSEKHYLSWLDELLSEFWRVLKPSGSLYMFCGSRLAADTELLVRNRFDVLSHIVWAKPHGPWMRQNKESLRAFFPATERIIFAAHYAGPYKPQSNEWSETRNQLKQNVFSPLISYFRVARESLGVSSKAINEATGTSMASHWFSGSQWQLPGEKHYKQLQCLFEKIAAEKQQVSLLERGHGSLVDNWQILDRNYRDLLKEHDYLRRPFSVTAKVPYTDVWTYEPVAFYPGKHPCEKPAEMMEHIIQTSSRPDDLVADFFMGSGATVKAAIKHGRRALGVELERERFEQTLAEINK
ncbi:site-specific DNA-methyltransferase [Pantoea ananatis]|uniref:DNA-methyltransferase n=1 Tax=Pantoea ananas TaxID=553 RepID=UPI001059F35F|nr:site-specific DNA-methyltransferase [Pantoea ananatis]TDL54726.1 site-specific DNA-methyltransferase [Pantoea ananatis]